MEDSRGRKKRFFGGMSERLYCVQEQKTVELGKRREYFMFGSIIGIAVIVILVAFIAAAAVTPIVLGIYRRTAGGHG